MEEILNLNFHLNNIFWEQFKDARRNVWRIADASSFLVSPKVLKAVQKMENAIENATNPQTDYFRQLEELYTAVQVCLDTVKELGREELGIKDTTNIMPSLKKIESEVAALPEPELRQFRSWFDEFDAQNWDRSLTADINNGKLDSLAAEALVHYRGKSGTLPN